MKRAIVIITLSVNLLLVVTGTAFAQDPNPPEPVKPFALDFFAWLMTDPRDWVSGGLFAVTGFFGALATAYTLIGGVMPATSGQARIDEISARLKRLSERLDALITADPGDPDAIRAVGERVENLADDLSKELWRQYAIAIVLYAVLGAFFAAALAQDVLQALVIGAGWTGLIGALNLRQASTAAHTSVTGSLDRAQALLDQAQARIQPGAPAAGPDLDAARSLVEGARNEVGLAKDIGAARRL